MMSQGISTASKYEDVRDFIHLSVGGELLKIALITSHI